MPLESWPLARLRPYERNPRTHSPAQIEQIAASIREFGFTNPILADRDGTIIAGHGRLLAAAKAGLAKVPVIVIKRLSETQRRALVIADNKLALNAGWDDELLAAELEALRDDGFNMDLVGFTDEELAILLDRGESAGGLTGEDATPEPPSDPITKLGDLYSLGRHRLLCGDATRIDEVERLTP